MSDTAKTKVATFGALAYLLTVAVKSQAFQATAKYHSSQANVYRGCKLESDEIELYLGRQSHVLSNP